MSRILAFLGMVLALAGHDGTALSKTANSHVLFSPSVVMNPLHSRLCGHLEVFGSLQGIRDTSFDPAITYLAFRRAQEEDGSVVDLMTLFPYRWDTAEAVYLPEQLEH